MPLSQVSIVGELVVGRQERVGLAIALDLRHLVEPLPARPRLGILAVDRLAGERLDDGEHAAVAQVAVVGDGQHVAAGLLLVGGHPLPQVAGVVAAQRRVNGEWLHQAGRAAPSRKMTLRCRLLPPVFEVHSIADEGREAARVVRLLRCLDGLPPGRTVSGGAGGVHQRLREGALREGHDDLDRGVGALAGLDHVIPAAAGGIGQHSGISGEQIREEAHVVGVVGHDQEIERPGELRQLAAGRPDLLTLSEPIGLLRPKSCAEGPGIH